MTQWLRSIALWLLAPVAVAAASADVQPAGAPDTMAERVKACIVCHTTADKAGRDAYYPRIAGKPEGYLFNQLRNFRDGRRHYRPMKLLLENLPDAYLREMARHFSALELAFPPPEPLAIPPEEADLARTLILRGDPARDIPACTACHGADLMGTAPFIPGLLGLPRVYLLAQFGNWRNGGLMRGQAHDCMSEIAGRLAPRETDALAAWLAARPGTTARPADAAAALPAELARRCGSIVLQSAGPQ
ncbi:cytochrome C [Nitrosovibrio sp. Nv17]|uniref:c-type cytochrome n=1 Tax=Nitrosovibrio sp. Nv17 TaxID=1855339 RepID=UPI00090873F7|nr:cytochrome C [Nitrosovibrio sp. Nv17]SFW13134.1 Cytochrome c553 [Nitrosovibrio sp. Nv17]